MAGEKSSKWTLLLGYLHTGEKGIKVLCCCKELYGRPIILTSFKKKKRQIPETINLEMYSLIHTLTEHLLHTYYVPDARESTIDRSQLTFLWGKDCKQINTMLNVKKHSEVI